VLQVIVAPTLEMLDDTIDDMMSSGEPLFRPCRVKQADPVAMTAHPHIKAKR